MQEGKYIVQHISKFKYLINQLACIKAKVKDGDAKEIILNNMSSSYINIVFTLNTISIILEDNISI